MTPEQVAAEQCEAIWTPRAALDAYPAREVRLGELTIARALPVKGRRLVGPWCFLDRFGPLSFSAGRPMDVATHPHIGLQTVSWLLEGEVVHDDSLGSEARLVAGGVNVMTAGGGIAHAERTPRDNSGRLNGVQLWVALPDAVRHRAAAFQHVQEVPKIETRGGLVSVFAGAMEHAVSPAAHYSDLLGADLQIHAGETLTLPLCPQFEHAVLPLEGDCRMEHQRLDAGVLYYLGTKRTSMSIDSRAGGRVLLVGGPPFPEPVLMWWNFVARTPQEIVDARNDWMSHRRFGEVSAYDGPRLDAPSLVRLAAPNPAS